MKCDRCGAINTTLTGSYFDTETICPDCEAKEKAHPNYTEAKRVENEHVRAGNYNFPGIGLPLELRPNHTTSAIRGILCNLTRTPPELR